MKKRLFILSLLTAFFVSVSFAQKDIVSSVKKKYDNLSYHKTTEQLIDKVENGDKSPEVLQNLANIYYLNSEMEEASKWYAELITLEEGNFDPENYFRYAQALKSLEKYDEADQMMQKFKQLKPDDSRSDNYNINYLTIIEKASDEYELENLDINSTYSDFGTSIYQNNLIFASTRDKNGKIYNWNDEPFLDLFQLNPNGNVTKLEGGVNTKYHESSSAFTQDGKTMYFTRNNFFKGKFKKNSENIHGLKIYKATLIEGKWRDIESLPFNSDEYNVAHPALSLDETKLYFASDMPGTIGYSDIFMVAINEDGTFGTPENLGSKINTEGRESFPFVSDNGTLYFSSDGHLGLGGLDVFKFNKFDTGSNVDGLIHNIGKPINSPKDDFGYIVNEVTLKGYVSSNREEGKGSDDIYSFTKKPCVKHVIGVLVDKDTNEKIPNADVTIYGTGGKVVKTLKSDFDGNYSFELPCDDKTYKALGEKETYENDSQIFTVNFEDINDIELKLSLKPIPQPAAVGTDLATLLNLEPIYFDFDEADIRPDAEIELAKIINYLKQFPTVKVDVRSHTDSRGDHIYNLGLSKRRNESTRAYIVNTGGIYADRLIGKFFGETQLTNKCSDGVWCTREQHQANRRSEFIVTDN